MFFTQDPIGDEHDLSLYSPSPSLASGSGSGSLQQPVAAPSQIDPWPTPETVHPTATSTTVPAQLPAPLRAPAAPAVRSTLSVAKSQGRKKASEPLSNYQQSIIHAISSETDEHEHFMISLAPALRRLEPRKQAMVRLRFQQILFDMEFGEE